MDEINVSDTSEKKATKIPKFYSYLYPLLKKKSTLVGVIGGLVVVAAIPFTVFLSQQNQDNRQHASEATTVTVTKKLIFNGRNEQDGITGIFPDGTIATNLYTEKGGTPSLASINHNFAPVVKDGRLYVYVIGEGGHASGKLGAAWYNLHVTDTGDGLNWTPFRLLSGNVSEIIGTAVENNKLHIFVKGYQLQYIPATTNPVRPAIEVGPNENLYVFSDSWRKISPDGIAEDGTRTPYQTLKPSSNTINFGGKQLTFGVENGKLVETIPVQVQVTSGPQQPPVTTAPVITRGANATATPATVNNTCLVSGCGRSASRCSTNYGCTRAYYTPESNNSCGLPILSSVQYKQDHSCPFVAGNGDDSVNSPCWINDDENKSVVSPAELNALEKFYWGKTGRMDAIYCNSTNTSGSVSTPTPTQSMAKATATPVPALPSSSCTYNYPGCGTTATRCSKNFGCTRAYYNPVDSNNACGEPKPGQVSYARDTSCPKVADSSKNTACDTNNSITLLSFYGTPMCTLHTAPPVRTDY